MKQKIHDKQHTIDTKTEKKKFKKKTTTENECEYETD